MTKSFKYSLFFLVTMLLLAGCFRQQKSLPSLNETFGKEDKTPFGSFVAFRRLKELFENRFIDTNDKPFDEAWEEMKGYSTHTKYSLYILITKNLIVTKNEADALLSFVKEGNDLFIAADYIDNRLLEKINCNEERMSEIKSEVAGNMKVTSVNTQENYLSKPADYKYYYYPFLNSFYGYDSTSTRVLGVNEINKPDYAVFFLGKGRLYLHAAPRTFSNYFLLTKNNYQYLDNILAYLRPEPKNIFWDEYYKNNQQGNEDGKGGKNNNGKNNNFSSLSVINKYPPLLFAFWLSVAAIVAFILFNIKRKQRIIKDVKPNENTTLVFTETVGRLYLQKKDNKNISEKMITYLYAHVRNRFFLDTNHIDQQFKITLSRKSGLGMPDTENLFNAIGKAQEATQVSDDDLLILNNQIQNFYKAGTDGRKFI